MPWTGQNLSGNPYAEGGSRFNPQGRYSGFLPAAGAGYDPSLNGGAALGGLGNNYAYQQSGTMGAPQAQQPQARGGQAAGGMGAYSNPYGDPLSEMLKSLGSLGMGNFGGGAPQAAGAAGGFEYNTGIRRNPIMAEGGLQAGMESIRSAPGGRAGSLIPGMTPAQMAEIERGMAEQASMQGNRQALQFEDLVNPAESTLGLAQAAAQASAGQRAQQFANRQMAHRLNQQNAQSDMQYGLLGSLLGAFM